ncbi:nucleoside deaminase [Natronocalculus amylovorans]|uniref:Nucleoside deaminase n=1 Tax=Natronocalculus amylovorans TaxID=2917812 RepID=A0AAE3FUB4_9EURY|nr:nucleoside deaminase [Natronocalculus amylovorans]MCL9815499.1 nucleoside deaminase [Natronocalculus amylovorans]NUE01987.1 nucleoside deaminase [Halorubraceae archaeon YAN]
MVSVDEFSHEVHMRRAIELAEQAVEHGNRPFGTVLVHNNEIIMEEENRVITENDIRRHPELHLAMRACNELDESVRAETVMYTSTEPCPMCAGGIRYAGLNRIYYSVGSDEITEFTGSSPITVRSAAILSGITDVIGPVLNEEGRAVHDSFYGSD